jgi:hypothetical protein
MRRRRVHSRRVLIDGGRAAGKIPQTRKATMSMSWEEKGEAGVVEFIKRVSCQLDLGESRAERSGVLDGAAVLKRVPRNGGSIRRSRFLVFIKAQGLTCAR